MDGILVGPLGLPVWLSNAVLAAVFVNSHCLPLLTSFFNGRSIISRILSFHFLPSFQIALSLHFTLPFSLPFPSYHSGSLSLVVVFFRIIAVRCAVLFCSVLCGMQCCYVQCLCSSSDCAPSDSVSQSELSVAAGGI